MEQYVDFWLVEFEGGSYIFGKSVDLLSKWAFYYSPTSSINCGRESEDLSRIGL
jgi:hypothetical protein